MKYSTTVVAVTTILSASVALAAPVNTERETVRRRVEDVSFDRRGGVMSKLKEPAAIRIGKHVAKEAGKHFGGKAVDATILHPEQDQSEEQRGGSNPTSHGGQHKDKRDMNDFYNYLERRGGVMSKLKEPAAIRIGKHVAKEAGKHFGGKAVDATILHPEEDKSDEQRGGSSSHGGQHKDKRSFEDDHYLESRGGVMSKLKEPAAIRIGKHVAKEAGKHFGGKAVDATILHPENQDQSEEQRGGSSSHGGQHKDKRSIVDEHLERRGGVMSKLKEPAAIRIGKHVAKEAGKHFGGKAVDATILHPEQDQSEEQRGGSSSSHGGRHKDKRDFDDEWYLERRGGVMSKLKEPAAIRIGKHVAKEAGKHFGGKAVDATILHPEQDQSEEQRGGSSHGGQHKDKREVDGDFYLERRGGVMSKLKEPAAIRIGKHVAKEAGKHFGGKAVDATILHPDEERIGEHNGPTGGSSSTSQKDKRNIIEEYMLQFERELASLNDLD